MNSFWRDVRFGTRLLLRNPGFTAAAVMAFALGVAANTAIFSVVYATLLAPLPYPEPDQLVMVWSRIQGGRNVTAAGDFLEWKKQATAFQGLNAFSGRGVNLSSNERPEQVAATLTTPGFLAMMGHRLEFGRDFVGQEGTAGRNKVVVLTHKFWMERFAADRGLVGHSIRIDGSPHTVVGILAPGPADRVQNKLYLPLAFAPEQINHDFHWLLVMGGLKPGVTLAQANADMKNVSARIAKAFPASNTGWSASVEPLKNNFLSDNTKTALWLLLGAVGFVLLIACASVARRLAGHDRPAVDRGEPRPRHGGRGARCGARLRAGQAHHGHDARVHAAVRGGRATQSAGAPVHPGGLRDLRRALRIRPRLAGGAAEHQRNPEGRRPCHGRRATPAAARARGRRVRTGPDAPLGRRSGHPQPAERGGGRSRVQNRAPAHLLSPGAEREADRTRAGSHVLRAADRARAGCSGRRLGLGLDGDARERHRFRDAVHHRRQTREGSRTAARRRIQHGHARLLQDVRHPHHARTRVHRTGSRRQRAGGNRERRFREPVLQGSGPADATSAGGAIDPRRDEARAPDRVADRRRLR